MSQEPNTTSDTNPPLRPPGDASAAASPPRFSFAPKKKAGEVPAVPVEQTPPPPAPAQPPLKRPPPGARLVSGTAPASGAEMPAPLTSVKQAATTSPFTKKTTPAPRTQLGMRIALIVLLVAALGEAYVIFLMRDDNTEANSQKPALLVKSSGPSGKPIEVLNDGAPPPTPAYAFLVNFTPQVAAGSEPRLFFETKTYHIGEIIAPEFGLKWTLIDDKERTLEFTDRQGHRYIKKF